MPEDRSPCRDFERGVCNRGDSCKYYHPEGAAPAEDVKLPICKDFQNKGCDRFRCKFLHITIEEEADYNNTGKLPEHGGHPERSSNPSSSGNDVCRDFLKGRCDRGSRCRYTHMPERELSSNSSPMGSMYGKRPRNDDYYGSTHTPVFTLVEEIELLKRKVSDLQKEASDLRQMNDTLYAQNARYRSQLDKESTNTASQVNNAYSPVVYPQYSQTAYPPKSADVPIASASSGIAYSPYSYQQY